MNKKLLVITIVILAIFNISLIYINNYKSHKIDKLILNNDKILLKNKWDFYQSGNGVVKVVHPSIELPKDGIYLIII